MIYWTEIAVQGKNDIFAYLKLSKVFAPLINN